MTSKEVTEFILERINPAYLNVYEILASMEYPIDDYKTFMGTVKLKSRLDDKEPGNLAELRQRFIGLLIGPHDMPIANARSALEKCHESIMTMLYPWTPLRNPRDDLEVPDTSGPTINTEFIDHVCRAEADEAVARLGSNATPIERRLVWVNSYFECQARYRIRGQIIDRRDYGPEGFVSGR